MTGRFYFPAIVKPNAEGSSKGISDVAVVTNRRELEKLALKNISLYKQDMLVEEFISGREFTVGIFGNGSDIHVFSPMEICYVNQVNQYNIYSYNVKRNYKEFIRYECPANISKETEAEMTNAARKIYEACAAGILLESIFSFLHKGSFILLRLILTRIGTGYSDFPMIAEFNGMDYNSLVWNVLKSALKRYGMKSYRLI